MPIPYFPSHCGFCGFSCNIECVPSSVPTPLLQVPQKAPARASPLVKVMDDSLLII